MRLRYTALAFGTIVLGLAVFKTGGAMPVAARDVLGDALWAAMMMWLISAAMPGVRLAWRAAAALAVSFAVEFSQLIHFPSLDALRGTIAGHLVLGSGFDPRDFVAYAAGVLAAAVLEGVFFRTRRT